MPLTHCHLHGYSKLAAKVSKKHMLNLYSFTPTSDPVAVAFFIFQCWFYTIFKVCKFKIIFIFTILSMVLCTRTTSILNLPRIMPLWLLGVRGKLWRGHCGGIFHLEWKKNRKAEVATRGALCKKVLGNFTKFTAKHLCQSLFFNKVAGLRHATLLKKRL